MRKGFTLIEMIAVIGIISVMSLLVMPTIINQITNKKNEISAATEQFIFSTVDLYLNDNIAQYPKTVGSVYCIKLEKLIYDDYLKSPLKDAKTGKEIDTSRFVKLMVNNYFEYDEYVILEKGKENVCP